jgi:hypothetical protein
MKNVPEDCRYVTHYEWPITAEASYTGGEESPDRVLVSEIPYGKTVTRTYCGIITHRDLLRVTTAPAAACNATGPILMEEATTGGKLTCHSMDRKTKGFREV